MQRLRIQPVAETAVLLLLAFAILWKGGKALDSVWLLALVAAGVALISRFDPTPSARIHPAIWATGMAFVLLTIMSFLFSTTRNYGFDEVLQTISLLLLWLWSMRMVPQSDRWPHRMMRVISVGLLLACVLGIGVYILQPPGRFVGSFFDYRFATDYWPNAWAEFVLLAWPMLGWLLVMTHRQLPTDKLKQSAMVLGWLVLGIVAGCFALSYSRGAAIALMVQLIIGIALVVWKAKPSIEWRRIGLSVAVILVTASIVFAGVNHVRGRLHPVTSVLEKATFSAGEGTSSIDERTQFWLQSIRLTLPAMDGWNTDAWRFALIGRGPYSFRFVQPHVQQTVLATSDHPHNVLLKLATERGIPAMLLFIAIVAVALVSAGRKLRTAQGTAALGTIALGVSVIGVLAHNMIDFNLQFVAIALPLWMTLGMLTAPALSTFPERRAILTAEALIAFALLLVTMIEGAFLGFSSLARKAEAARDSQTAFGWYALTDRSLFPRDSWLSRAVLLLGQDRSVDALVAADHAIGLNREDARGYRLKGDILLRANRRPEALEAYRTAYAAGKYNDIGITLGLVRLLKNNRTELTARKHEFEELMNDFGLAILYNTHFVALSKNVEDVEALCDLMGQLFPGDAALYGELKQRVIEHAKQERSRIKARPIGYLW